MAQQVGYYENNVEFTEGPFVIVNAGGWRIEVELKEHHCPVLPDSSIYRLCGDRLGHPLTKLHFYESAVELCDWLNQEVERGTIVLNGRGWICPLFVVSEIMET